MNPRFLVKWVIVFVLAGAVYLGASYFLYHPDECGILKNMYKQTILAPTAHAISFEESLCALDVSYRSFGFPAFVVNRGATFSGWDAHWAWYPTYLLANFLIILILSYFIAKLWQKGYTKPGQVEPSVGG